MLGCIYIINHCQHRIILLVVQCTVCGYCDYTEYTLATTIGNMINKDIIIIHEQSGDMNE